MSLNFYFDTYDILYNIILYDIVFQFYFNNT